MFDIVNYKVVVEPNAVLFMGALCNVIINNCDPDEWNCMCDANCQCHSGVIFFVSFPSDLYLC